MVLRVEALDAEYRDAKGQVVRAAQDVTFQVPPGRFFTLLGPSGCGKTTTLRCIAGLERPAAGRITLVDRPIYDGARNLFIEPEDRNIGMVFQSYAIWPHMSVFANTAFPLEVAKRREPADARRDRVMQALATVGLDHLAERDATKLSGGQQQRLALARALVMQPALLLLDEPLSNLDAKLRERMRFELKRIQREFGLTTVYVTHDQDEALALSDEVAVMQDGRIIQRGSPRDIYLRPATRFVADFIGRSNLIEGEVAGPGDTPGTWRIATGLGLLAGRSDAALTSGRKVALVLRPENLLVAPPADTGCTVEAVVDGVVYIGAALDIQFRAGDQILLARTHPALSCAAGDRVTLGFDPSACTILTD